MPTNRITDRSPFGSSTFNRMRGAAQMPLHERQEPELPTYLLPASHHGGELVFNQNIAALFERTVRFDRATVDGLPGIVMQRRNDVGMWVNCWTLPTQSKDAREGMIGWLATQRHRWERFARMLDRQGPKALTDWVFELMVMPTTAHARSPQFMPFQEMSIDPYHRSAQATAFRPTTSPERRHHRGCL